MLLQMEQSRRLALTSRTAVASASASPSLERKIWKARRCALLLPTPGSFFNSSMSRVIGSANLDIERFGNCVIWPKTAAGSNGKTSDQITQLQNTQFPNSSKSQSAQHAAHGGLHGLVDLARRLVDRRRDQILQHFDVARLHHFRINLQAEQLLAPVHPDVDRATARRSLDHSLLHLLLQCLVLLLRLGHQLLQVEPTHEHLET